MKSFIVMLASACILFGMYQISPYKEMRTPLSVTVTAAAYGTIDNTVTLRGTVIEQKRESVFSDGTAVIRHAYVQIGDTVKKGQLLMALQPLTQKAQITAAIAEDLQLAIEETALAAANGDLDILEQQSAVLSSAITAANTNTAPAAQIQYLYSPIDGIVMDIAGKEGESVSAFSPSCIISDMTQLAVRADVSETSVNMLQKNMPCTVTIPAVASGSITGTIATVMPYAARQSSLLATASEPKTTVLIAFDNAPATLRPGYNATVKIVINREEDALLVPYETIGQDSGGREYVMRINPEGESELCYITTGYELADQVQILDGIRQSDLLICNPETITPNKKVIIANAES